MHEPPVVLDDWRHTVSHAPDWRLLFTDTRHVEFWLMLRELPRGTRVLDFGCGSGIESLWLERQFGFCVTGVDVSEELVSLARENASRSQSRVSFEVADGRYLPFARNSFDAVFSTDVFGHIPRAEQAIREVVRVVRPGGEFAVLSETDGYHRNPWSWQYHICTALGFDPWIDWHNHVNMQSAEWLRQRFCEAGTTELAVRSFPRNHLAIYFLHGYREDTSDVLAAFPQTTHLPLMRAHLATKGAHALLRAVLPLRIARRLSQTGMELLLSRLLRRDGGGIYLHLRKS